MRLRLPARPLLAATLVPLAAACGGTHGVSVATVERAYQEARFWKDRLDVTRATGSERAPDGTPPSDLRARSASARADLRKALAAVTPPSEDEDRRALEIIRRALEKDLGEEPEEPPGKADAGKVDCDYDAGALAAGRDGPKALSERMYACFGEAARRLSLDGRPLDRLTIFSLLPVTPDRARRKRLFMALEPVWRSVNGDGGPSSPYRALLRLGAGKRRTEGSSVEAGAAGVGIPAAEVESWLVSVLERWRDAVSGAEIEPWDFAWEAGRASRALGAAIPLESLRRVNDVFYRDLGVDPAALGVRYDLEPRDGKDPVAFTTFGARPRLEKGAWTPGEPWVFAAYAVGSVDNLNELLHETGHAVHIAAIRTRPAFMDWPDSDLFTEAIADIAALEMFEPDWQAKYLGTSASLADSLRSKYAGIVMDTAWALFEIRMHRDPALDPNRVWTEITGRYFRIRPHPDLSWWAVRGQLVGSPGYMLNYAAGAILIADIRARVKERHGPYATGDASWYPWVSERLYRFGLARPSRQVVEEFLGRSPSPRALLEDLARAGAGRGPGR